MTDVEWKLNRYKSGYFCDGGLYYRSNDSMFRYVLEVLENYKEQLPEESINFITKHINMFQLIMICDKQAVVFDNYYCDSFYHTVKALMNYKGEIDNPKFMEYVKPCISFYYGYEQYISESSEFRDFINNVVEKSSSTKERVKGKLHEILCGLAAYSYYHYLDPKIIDDVAIAYMCNYREVKEIFNMNGIYLFNRNLNDNYYEIFLKVFNSYQDMKKGNQKVIL